MLPPFHTFHLQRLDNGEAGAEAEVQIQAVVTLS